MIYRKKVIYPYLRCNIPYTRFKKPLYTVYPKILADPDFFKDQGRSLIKRSRKGPSTRAITCIAIFVWKGESRSSFSELQEKHSTYNHQSKFQIVCFDSSRILYCFVTSRSNHVWKRCTEISCKILLFSDKQPNVAGVLALTRKRLKTQGISCLTLSLSLST